MFIALWINKALLATKNIKKFIFFSKCQKFGKGIKKRFLLNGNMKYEGTLIPSRFANIEKL